MSSRKTWVEAAWVFLSSRLAILCISAVAVLRIQPPRLANYWFSWLHWDVYSYIGVAVQGYSQMRNTVFFPLLPLLIRGTGLLLGGSLNAYYLVGLLLANLFFYLALVLFYQLVNEHFDAPVARNALFYLAFSAYGIFFFVGYTESLFLLLSLALFWSLQRARYWLAGCCGFLVALTHSQGIVLLVPFLVVMFQRFWPRTGEQRTWWPLLRSCFPLSLIPTGVAVFMLYLFITKHDPLAFSTAEASFWNRHLTFPPWSVLLTFGTFFQPAVPAVHLMNVVDLFFTLAPLLILLIGWKQLPLQYALFALSMILFNLSYPQGTVEPLSASPRYMLLAFPVFLLLGKWGKQPQIERLISVCLLPLFALNTLLYVNHLWIG